MTYSELIVNSSKADESIRQYYQEKDFSKEKEGLTESNDKETSYLDQHLPYSSRYLRYYRYIRYYRYSRFYLSLLFSYVLFSKSSRSLFVLNVVRGVDRGYFL